MRLIISVLSLLLVSVGVTVFTSGRQVSQSPPPYLAMLSAEIEQEAATGAKMATSRVFFRLRFAARPPCGTGQPPPSYAFLIDDDRSRATGATTTAFREVGIDTQLEILCDEATGRFVSALDEVTLRTSSDAGGGSVLELAAPRRAFATADLHWIAIAREGRRYTRLPETGYAVWQSVDVWKH